VLSKNEISVLQYLICAVIHAEKSNFSHFSNWKTARDAGINYALRMGLSLQVDKFFPPAKRLSQGFKLAVGVRALTRRIF